MTFANTHRIESIYFTDTVIFPNSRENELVITNTRFSPDNGSIRYSLAAILRRLQKSDALLKKATSRAKSLERTVNEEMRTTYSWGQALAVLLEASGLDTSSIQNQLKVLVSC